MTDHEALIDNGVTTEQQIEILRRAHALVKEPDSWVQGSWKCPVVIPGAISGNAVATTPNGTPRYQYCIEGAVNQATYDVLGEERAKALGAVRFDQEKGELVFSGAEDELGYDPTMLFGLDTIASDLYGYECALEYNDHEPEMHMDDDGIASHHNEVHEGVMDILSTRLKQLTGRKEAA